MKKSHQLLCRESWPYFCNIYILNVNVCCREPKLITSPCFVGFFDFYFYYLFFYLFMSILFDGESYKVKTSFFNKNPHEPLFFLFSFKLLCL
jgi:hypothetical protein